MISENSSENDLPPEEASMSPVAYVYHDSYELYWYACLIFFLIAGFTPLIGVIGALIDADTLLPFIPILGTISVLFGLLPGIFFGLMALYCKAENQHVEKKQRLMDEGICYSVSIQKLDDITLYHPRSFRPPSVRRYRLRGWYEKNGEKIWVNSPPFKLKRFNISAPSKTLKARVWINPADRYDYYVELFLLNPNL